MPIIVNLDVILAKKMMSMDDFEKRKSQIIDHKKYLDVKQKWRFEL